MLSKPQPRQPFFTADLHLGHAAVIEYSERPFASVDQMDAALVDNWNSVVDSRDDVYIVGDVALCKPDKAKALIAALKGRKFLVFGNHDKALRRKKELLELFAGHSDMMVVKVQDADATDGVRRIVLCHYPMIVWDRSHYGTWHLHGHCHGSLPDDAHALRLDVGVDAWMSPTCELDRKNKEIVRGQAKLYRPIAYSEIAKRMSAKAWKPADGHRDRGGD